MTTRINAWAAGQPGRRPSRSEAIRRLVEKGLGAESALASDASLDRQIADKEKLIANMPEHPAPSPEAALAAMDKAMAQNDLIKMKNARGRRKSAKRG